MIAERSVTAVMEGQKYNRAVRVHKLVYEVMMRLAWKGFLQWLETKHVGEVHNLEQTLKSIEAFQNDVCHAQIEELLQSPSCTCIFKLFQDYLDSLRDGSGLSSFWISYLDMSEILLALLRASREGYWMLHLAAIRQMIPWCIAYDKLNYARFLHYYYAMMFRLPIDYPDVHDHFMQGGFSVQIGKKNPYGRIPVNQTIEETVKKDTQTPGGTKDFSLKCGAVRRYYMTSEYRSMYLRQLRDMIGHQDSDFSHPDLHPPRIKRDETDIQSLVDLMETSWSNPFSPEHQELVSLSTATAASPDIAKDFLGAQKLGEEAYQAFKQERLEATPPATQFHDKMTKRQLKTFSNIQKRTRSQQQSKQVVLKAERKLFGQMILVAESRDLCMSEVMAHPLGPLPWSLANGDGSMRKTNKAALARELEKKLPLLKSSQIYQ